MLKENSYRIQLSVVLHFFYHDLRSWNYSWRFFSLSFGSVYMISSSLLASLLLRCHCNNDKHSTLVNTSTVGRLLRTVLCSSLRIYIWSHIVTHGNGKMGLEKNMTSIEQVVSFTIRKLSKLSRSLQRRPTRSHPSTVTDRCWRWIHRRAFRVLNRPLGDLCLSKSIDLRPLRQSPTSTNQSPGLARNRQNFGLEEFELL